MSGFTPTANGTRRLRVMHRTTYRYTRPVLASYNELRLTPRAAPGQAVLDSAVQVRPAARLREFVDYWGTRVQQFDVHLPHDWLEIIARSTVETGSFERRAQVSSDLGWSDLDAWRFRDRFSELLVETPRTPHDERLVEVARSIRSESTPGEAYLAVTAWVRGCMAYERGTTAVHTTAAEAWEAGRGVCQDFVHVALVLLRAMGVPSRYVSGYVLPTEVSVGECVEAESHAWVEAWVDGVWVGHDVTSGRAAGNSHVLVGTGRDYGDVSPVKGVYAGGGTSELDVAVEITRLR